MSAAGAGLAQAPAAALPHDIRGLLPYAPPWWVYLLLGLLLAAVLAGAWLGFKAWRARRRRGPEAASPLDPWSELLAGLEAMRAELDGAQDLPRRAAEDFFYRLSMRLRIAIELGSAVAATDLTLGELRQPLRDRLPLGGEAVEAVLAFLERADQVKFAEAPATVAEARDSVRQVRDWAEALRPVAVTPIALSAEGGSLATGRP